MTSVFPGIATSILQKNTTNRGSCLAVQITIGRRAQRYSIVTFWPSTQPDSCTPNIEKSNNRHRFLLRLLSERPCNAAAGDADELAPSHSITSSARAISDCGTVSPSAFAVLTLIINSYFVGACTGRLAGFSPLRMRST